MTSPDLTPAEQTELEQLAQGFELAGDEWFAALQQASTPLVVRDPD
jgi:hypothetical protein